MTFKITIKELHEAVVDVEAKLTNKQLNRLNPITGKIQTIIYSNRKTPHLNNEKPLLTEGLNFK